MMVTAAKILSDGVLKLDGGSVFGQVPKVAWENSVTTDRKNRITLGLNCLLLQVCGKNVLVDTGVGTKENDKDKENLGLVPSRLLKGLKALGLTTKDIHAVILTHLHFDHCGGCTRLDRAGSLVPTFAKATYYVQRQCWEDACSPNERCFASHRPESFLPIEERGQIELLDGDSEILLGLNVIVTDGHSKGHQMVMFNHGGERVVFLGDIVPTHHHLNLPVISAFDYSPERTLEQKREVLRDAERQGWLIVFPHGYDTKAGYLERRGDTTYLRPVAL
ncbi:MAG TPA: MBL fold metallo-hydrolase [Dehalococcoidia bacterium]|jgi:glyoxylase-like metal-dependent hydrolase (beta-lactamase superfamily II)|nr:MBL fold metallo-hydrolase [Dehalococcoidia bacterium]